MMKLIFTLFSMMMAGIMTAQNTVGLLSFDQSRQYDGYTLIYPHNQPNVFLLNNCGEIVHTWTDADSIRPGNTAYILADGRLLKTKRNAVVVNDPIWAGGGGAWVELRSWDNDLLWQFHLNNASARLHHEAIMLPNGNVLMLAWENKSAEEAIAAGRDTALLTEGELWPDYLLEVRPIGTDSFETVWEWHVWDHLIQDFDSTKANFGVVADNPQLVDINWDTSDGEADWMHSNAIDYHPELDQIILSVPTFNELWIIDHSTSTEEAAGHFGGFGGRGGDLLYRYGNPAAYDRGTQEDQVFFFQHSTKWIDDFLTPSHPHFGKIALYNNRVGANYSAVNIMRPSFDMYSWSYDTMDGVWLPSSFDWSYVHPDTTIMHSTGLSSIQLLPNGNTLICAGRRGYLFEITPDEEIVWEYRTPLRGGQPVAQGEVLEINNNLTFAARRYPADYPAFSGRDLSAKGYLEVNPDTTFCDSTTPTRNVVRGPAPRLYPNPATETLTVEWEDGGMGMIDVYDLLGRHVYHDYGFGGRAYLDISKWHPGLYYVMVDGGAVEKLVVE